LYDQLCGVLSPSKKTIILGVRADPEPDEVGAALYCERAVMRPHTHRPEPPYLLEMQRRVLWALPQQRVATIRELPHFRRQAMVASPEATSHRAGA